MALSYKARRRWSLVWLLVGLPIYIVACVTLVDWLRELTGRPPILVELLIFVVLGVIWAFPMKYVFQGVGKADPDAADEGAPRP